MDQDAKIQQYVLLAKGLRGRGLTDLIAKATGDPAVFGFGELLDVQSVKELQGTDLASHNALLQLFAYGTWSDYQANASSLPPLSEAQALKLKQLTVASLAASEKVLPYSQLQSAVSISGVRELEDFLINHCFYAGVITAGKLDQKQACLQVHDVIGRDVRREDLPQITQRMACWIAAGDELLRAIEARVNYATATADAARQHREELDARIEEAKRNIKAEARANDALMDEGLMMGGLDMMDEDRVGTAGLGLGPGEREERMMIMGPGGARGERAPGRPKSRRR
ncbi:hypothetical protein CHLRE_16g651500v5 [Chlamydomonas reinhardtii]|uniref:Uncharacterized protein n=1 Tax=Chlamydomonas reinhardtii TaxID=3055 RepID=A8J9F7_CHLRE|nr:uncharacterized protein CHLRE_16g651500v5 [Chlamydomonas reinhardtii]PNW71372.1 hypothetical protein CHLRE_16g651500v5 [Chlamydomonas reinhardtii]|eukprot:XP_001698155.1 predicted protein [Chlamydomonas reinhardtii]